ncbi:hypothetical protein NC652_014302 [Populus alba x Populus x berolinensis]|nr:hypothetical protein NC652_014302 [Populus alba x Populus x berolinensis]
MNMARMHLDCKYHTIHYLQFLSLNPRLFMHLGKVDRGGDKSACVPQVDQSIAFAIRTCICACVPQVDQSIAFAIRTCILEVDRGGDKSACVPQVDQSIGFAIRACYVFVEMRWHSVTNDSLITSLA